MMTIIMQISFNVLCVIYTELFIMQRKYKKIIIHIYLSFHLTIIFDNIKIARQKKKKTKQKKKKKNKKTPHL